MASLVSTTVNGDLKVTGSSNLFFEGSASSNTFEPGTRIYGAGITLTGGAYTSVFEYTVPGGLAGNFRFFVKGTTGNVVVPTQVDVVLNHSKDITIKSQTGNYTPLHVKVLTNNNEDCLVQLKADTSGNANVTVYIDVIAFGDGSVSFSSFGSYTGTSLEHKCNFGFSFSTIDNTNASKFVMDGGNADGGRLGIGTNSPAQPLDVLGKVSINSDGTLNWGAARDYGRLTWDTTNSRAIVRGESGKNLSLGANGTQDYVFIKTDGNVGIGTTGPEARLDLHAGNMLIGDSYLDHHSSNDNYGLQIKSTDATQVGLELRSNGGSNAAGTWHATLYGAGSYYGFLDAPWGAWDVRKTVNGALQIDQGSGLETVLTTATTPTWANLGAGYRTNYTLGFRAPSSAYAGLYFEGTNGGSAGYFLIRGTSDTGVYTAEGITLVADQGWLTLAQRTTSSKGVRIMTGSSTSRDRITVSTDGDIVLGVPTNSLAPATTTTLKGYSVQYDSGGAGERLSNTGFLTWHTGGSWTGNERMWALTNASNMAGGGGPRFTLLRGTANNVVPTLGNNGTLGTNTVITCFWTNNGDFHNAGPVSIVTQTLPSSNKFHVSSNQAGSASKSSIAVVSVADNSTFNNGTAALHVINSGNRGTAGNSIGSDLLRLEFSNGIHTIFNKDGSVGIGTTNPGQKLDVVGAGNFTGNLYLAGNSASRFYFGSKRALEGQIINNFLDVGEDFGSTRMRSSTSVYPTNSITLGTSSSRWSTIYGAAGNFSGTVTATTFSGTLSGTADKSNMVTGSAFATTGSPSSVLEYQQAASITDTKLAPTSDWYNTIRMGHGNPYSYYSNTIAMQMTGTGAGQIKTQRIANNVAQGWRTVWDSGNDGSGSGLDADKLDGLEYNHFAYRASGGTGYYIVSSWLQFSGTYGPYWNAGVGAGWHIYPASTDSMRWRASSSAVRSNLRLDVGSSNYGNLCASTTMGYGLRKANVNLSTDSDWDLLINTDGNVGIGTTNPSQKLDVNGNTELNGAVNIVGGGWLSFDGEQGLRKSGSWLYLADGGFTSGLYTRIKIRVDGYDVSPYQDTASVTSATTLGISTKRWYNVYSQAGNFSGTVTAGGIALGAGNLTTTGNISGNGSGLTALNASNIGSGTINVARLGSGATSSKFLRGDNTWQTISSGSSPNNSTITISTGTGITGSTSFTLNQASNQTISLACDLGELPDMTQSWSSNDEFIVLDSGSQKRKRSAEIFGSNAFNSTTIPTNNNQLTNGAGYTTNTGTMSSWNWGINSESTGANIGNGELVRIIAGTNVTVSRSGNDVTVSASGGGSTPNNKTITLSAGNGLSNGGAFTTNQSFNETITFNITGLNSSGNGSTVMKHISVGAGTAQTSSNGISFSQSGGISISASGSTVSFSSSSASDYRLKKNVTDFNSESWTKVKSVSCRKFDFDAEKFAQAMQDDYTIPRPASYGGRIGFIAHELEALGIDGAVEGEKDGVDENGIPIYQKVSYTTLVPVLWGALNEAIRKIEILESKVQALEDSS
tara:strand:- start:10561 stop:15141 length:4581 start_codon:yes stop_codon:yes gene_type:complete